MVRTNTGPGGEAGPLQVDLEERFCRYGGVMQPYSESEAVASFQRTLQHHRANGW